MKTILRYFTLTTLLLFGCKETIIQERIPKEFTNDLLHADLVGKVYPINSKAKVFVSQIAVIDSQEINSNDGSFTFRDLRSGNYDVTIRSNDYRIFKKSNVQLTGGSIIYFGEIKLSTVPDQIEGLYPEDKSEIVHDWRYGRITISILFNESMDRESVEKAFSTFPASEGIFTWGYYTNYPYRALFADKDGFSSSPGATITTFSKVKSMTYTLSRKDSYTDTLYSVTIGTGAKDTAGNHLRFPLKFSFRTVQSYTTQNGILTSPVHGDIDVNPLQSYGINITFPRRMDRTSTEAAITILPAMNKVFLWTDENKLLIYTGGPLLTDTTITVSVDSTAKDKDGVLLGHKFTFSFRTAALTMNYTYPQNGSLFISPTQIIQMNFNSYVKIASVQKAFTITPAVSGTFKYGGYSPYESLSEIVFTPNAPLQTNTKYTVTLSDSVRDMYDVKMKKPYSFSFITRP